MTLEIYKTIFNICPVLLRPIIKILLSAGISYKQFSLVTRRLYVDVALEHFGVNGRAANISRGSIITGISRSEVRKLKNENMSTFETLNSSQEAFEGTLNNASKILYGWFKDPKYVDKHGEPLVISLSGMKEPSFPHLMKKYGGDLKAGTMLKELLKTNAVELINGERLKVLTRYYMPLPADSTHIVRVAHVIADFATTMHSNMMRQEGDQSKFEARAYNTSIPTEHIPKFQEFMEENGMQFLERIDDWLTAHQIPEPVDQDETTTLGAGLYMIDRKNKTINNEVIQNV